MTINTTFCFLVGGLLFVVGYFGMILSVHTSYIPNSFEPLFTHIFVVGMIVVFVITPIVAIVDNIVQRRKVRNDRTDS